MRRKPNAVSVILVLAVLSLLWSSFPFIHRRTFPNLARSEHSKSVLQTCSTHEGTESKAKHVGAREETQDALVPVLEDDYIQQWQNGTTAHDTDALSAREVTSFVKEIMSGGSSTSWRLQCATSIAAHYDSLQATADDDGGIQYLFALDLYQAISVLPTLLGAVIEAIRFLGPRRCAVSLVEGRSTDGTYQILAALKIELEHLGAVFYLSTSDVSPQDGKQDRFAGLAFLRNLALAPLVMESDKYSPDAQVIFLNDVYLCPHDIMELLYQQRMQQAIMTCGMDWSHAGAIFYDIYVARSIVGETFWQIAQDGAWHFSANLFWADRPTRAKFQAHQPFQVYACWNGGAVIAAKPIMQRRIRFRRNVEGECYMGEPTLFAKDLWRLGIGRIQVVPTVNVGYDNGTERARDVHGRVEDYLNMTSGALQTKRVEWQENPPSLVKCMPEFHEPYWVPST